MNLRVLRQASASAIAIYLLPDFLKVTEEHHRRILGAISAVNVASIAYHTPLTVDVLALQRGLDFALNDVDAVAALFVVVVVAAVIITMPAEARCFGADFGADGLV